jgi:hypothetical protein
MPRSDLSTKASIPMPPSRSYLLLISCLCSRRASFSSSIDASLTKWQVPRGRGSANPASHQRQKHSTGDKRTLLAVAGLQDGGRSGLEGLFVEARVVEREADVVRQLVELVALLLGDVPTLPGERRAVRHVDRDGMAVSERDSGRQLNQRRPFASVSQRMRRHS